MHIYKFSNNYKITSTLVEKRLYVIAASSLQVFDIEISNNERVAICRDIRPYKIRSVETISDTRAISIELRKSRWHVRDTLCAIR